MHRTSGLWRRATLGRTKTPTITVESPLVRRCVPLTCGLQESESGPLWRGCWRASANLAMSDQRSPAPACAGSADMGAEVLSIAPRQADLDSSGAHVAQWRGADLKIH